MAGLFLYEDDHLLVVNKPSGVNTHKPDVFAPDGIHEWLTKRGRKLSVLHRLDKDTSGVLVFGKTTRANQSLTQQFTKHRVKKEYLFLSDNRPKRIRFCEESPQEATWFEYIEPVGDNHLIKAEPVTGKTHQIRRHSANCRFPVLGDAKYGGAPAARLMLHAHRVTFEHPATGESVTFEASVPAVFEDLNPVTAAREFRELLFDTDTNAYRLVSGAADGLPDIIVDWYAGTAFVQWQSEKVDPSIYDRLGASAIYEQISTKQKRTTPVLVGAHRVRPIESQSTGARGAPLQIKENGLTYLINFGEGFSTGIFLDQRENRRRLLAMPLAGKRVLNCFAYTCAFSVVAAKAGALTTSVDLSRNYLEWGKDNFRANELDPARHEFVAGDVFAWLRTFAQRKATWDVVLLDPPTFSTTKKGRSFRAERDYEALATSAFALVAPGGTLFCSTNQRTLAADNFEKALVAAARTAGRKITAKEFATLPFDFRTGERERAYLKTWWITLE